MPATTDVFSLLIGHSWFALASRRPLVLFRFDEEKLVFSDAWNNDRACQ